MRNEERLVETFIKRSSARPVMVDVDGEDRKFEVYNVHWGTLKSNYASNRIFITTIKMRIKDFKTQEIKTINVMLDFANKKVVENTDKDIATMIVRAIDSN